MSRILTQAMPRPLADRCAIVTGASRGLGFQIACQYLEAGAGVTICARDETQLKKSAALLRQLADGGRVCALKADISKSADVAAVVAAALAEFGRLDILVNNAAIVGPIGTVESIDWAQWMRVIEINFLGSVLMSRAVLPHFKQCGYGKIIQLSGGGATQPLPTLSAYATSKTAVIRFVETLAEETRGQGIDVNAVAPGALNTRMLDEFLAADPGRISPVFRERSLQQKQDGGVPLSRGAELAVFLGSAASDGISGKLISAVWDPWTALPRHRDALNSTDVYTLRRVLPEDRGMSWGDGA